ncbi:hypothetical protein YTPLAS72_27370 [Nitrospira sp.]|nr:hypothetical protein YTPLAS72_27370 [Nitrospira sp.]
MHLLSHEKEHDMTRAVRWFSCRRSRFSSQLAVWRSLLALACLVTLSACGGSESPPVPPAPSVSNGTLTGRVIASDGTGGIPNATVAVGSARTSSGSDGSYTLSVPPADRTVVRVEASGFAENLRLARVTAGQTTPLTIQLVRAGVAQTVSRASGGTVTLPNSTASLVLPANGLLPQTGGTPAADVTVSLTPITVAGTTNEMPGDFTTATGGGIAQIESFGALLVDIRDTNNATYGLASGSTATIRIPVSTRSSAVLPTTIPLYYLDLATGRWVEDGQATLGGSASDRFYEGVVSRIAYWNADLVMETIVVSGCVRNNSGQPVDGALVESEGIDYSGSSQVFTAPDGSFQIPIRKNGKATIAALVNGQLTNTVTAGPSGTNVAVNDCLTTTTSTGLSIKLTWGASPADVDSHLFIPNGDHVFFGAKGALAALPFASLDVDDRDSFGPEVVTITQLMQGTYTYAVHNFSGTFTPGLTESPTRVELNQNGQITVFTPPSGEGTKPWWDVFTIVVDAQCQVSVTPVNTWLDQAPASPAGTPAFCTVN